MLLVTLLLSTLQSTVAFNAAMAFRIDHIYRQQKIISCRRQDSITRNDIISLRLSTNGDNNDNDKVVEFTAGERKEMEELVVSLSKVSSDTDRRGQLAKLFEEKIDSDYDDVAVFADQFNTVLIDVGEQLRQKAAEEYEQKLQQQEQQEAEAEEKNDVGSTKDEDDDEEQLPSFPLPGQAVKSTEPIVEEKSPQELQLWALVDMMVQSKTIAKRASGDLGSQSKFG